MVSLDSPAKEGMYVEVTSVGGGGGGVIRNYPG